MLTARKVVFASFISAASLLAACGNGEESAPAESIGEAVDYTITGIEPGAGVSSQAESVLEEYENLEGWEVEHSSTAGMTTELSLAIQNEEPIIVVGWVPHWKFEQYDLKFLEDPNLTFGEEEEIHTFAREGLAEDIPGAFAIIDAFYWEPEDMQEIILAGQEMEYDQAAAEWVEENQDKVAEWTADAEPGNNESVRLVSTPWDSEFASSEVLAAVLEQEGYNVTITNVDPAVMFQAVADGDADATVAPWLPTTHAAFYEEHGDDVVELGPNMVGTQNGLVVPDYVDIDSIEDLTPPE